MFLHIGNSRVVKMEEVIGIFNMELKNNQVNMQFLESNKKDDISREEKKESNSFIVTPEKILYSNISPLTLQKRIEKSWEE